MLRSKENDFDARLFRRRLVALEKQNRKLTLQLAQLRHKRHRTWADRVISLAYELRRTLWPRRYRFKLSPGGQAVSLSPAAPKRWRSVGTDPNFILSSIRGKLPHGWVRLRAEMSLPPHAPPPFLYFESKAGFSEQERIVLPLPKGNVLDAVVRLPHGLVGLRIDPMDSPGEFMLGGVEMTELSLTNLPKQLFLPSESQKAALQMPGLVDMLRGVGFSRIHEVFAQRARQADMQGTYLAWVASYDTLSDRDRTAIAGRIAQFAEPPLISVVMPTWNTPENCLRRALDSVRAQLYPNWELCIADDASSAPHVRRILDGYAALDPRIKVAFRPLNGHIGKASNTALELVQGTYVACLDHDDELAAHALYMVAEEINAHPDAVVLYSDEDKLDGRGRRTEPHFKPDWSPHLLLNQNYACHLTVVRTDWIRAARGFREGYDGSQDHDLLLRCTAGLAPERIRHIPHVLYHWRSMPGSTAADVSEKPYIQEAGVRAVSDHLQRAGLSASVQNGPFRGTYRVHYPLPNPAPLVSILIPTRDGYSLLKRCVESIRLLTDYPRYEILIIDNQTREPRALEYLAELREAGVARVLAFDAPFNFAAINNVAAGEARGEVLCLLNNDVEVINEQWLTELVSRAVLGGVGAVGAKLYYANDSVQHAGVVAGLGGVAGHFYKHAHREAFGEFGRLVVDRNVSAVTAACLVVRKAIYQEVGGMNERDLAVAFNDVDFCFRILEAGYKNLWTPYAELYHHESLTRGAEDTPEKKARFEKESNHMQQRWSGLIAKDPYFNPNLGLVTELPSLAWPPRAKRPWVTD
ncbi:MAG: glycosyltransferase family 2 protein [Myxococcaceae bacterium]